MLESLFGKWINIRTYLAAGAGGARPAVYQHQPTDNWSGPMDLPIALFLIKPYLSPDVQSWHVAAPTEDIVIAPENTDRIL